MATAMKLISSTMVGSSGISNITFSNIPATYTDLRLVLSARSTASNPGYQRLTLFLSLNGSLINYSRQLAGFGADGVAGLGYSTGNVGNVTAADSTAGTFGSADFYFSNYTSSTTKLIGMDITNENNSTQNFMQVISTGYSSITNPISSIAFTLESGNFAEYSSASLYGILKGDGGATVS